MKKNKMAKEEINGILIGIYLYANAFVVTLPAINNILVLFLLGVTILYFFNNRSFKIMKASSAIVILLIICWFAVSYILRQGISNITLFDYMTKFLFYGVTAFLITYREFSIKKVYQTITIASILLIPYIAKNNFFNLSTFSTIDYQLLMTMSYRLLPGILTSIICLISKDENKYMKLISVLILLIFGYTYINMANRGAMLAVVFFVLAIYMYNKIKDLTLKNVCIIIVIVILLIVVIVNIIPILYQVKAILDNFGITFRTIDKMIYLLENDIELTNGREGIYEKAIEDTKETYILGNGIGMYEDKYNSGYIHNLFIQIVYEGGLIWSTLFGVWIIMSIKKFTKLNEEQKQFIIFLIAIAIVQLLFSSYYWGSQKFWFLIAYMFQVKINNENIKGDERDVF